MHGLLLIDELMKLPSSPEKGKRIAKVCNEMEAANDSARYFGLGIDYHGDGKVKHKGRRAAEKIVKAGRY